MTQAPSERKTRLRKGKLTASGHGYSDLARLANVSYSMAYKWMNGERESAKIERAFIALTNGREVTK